MHNTFRKIIAGTGVIITILSVTACANKNKAQNEATEENKIINTITKAETATITQVTAPDYSDITVADEIILNLVCETDMPFITQVFFNNPDSDKNVYYSQWENMTVDDICNLRSEGTIHIDGIFCRPESLSKLREIYTFLNKVELKNEGLVYVTVCTSSDKEEQLVNDKFAAFLTAYVESEQQTEDANVSQEGISDTAGSSS